MKQEINPKDTSRAQAFELWMKAPNPMVTFFKTIDVTRIVKVSRKRGYKFNMLLDYCIGRAASTVKEFYLLPVGNKLMQYDLIAVNMIVKNKEGEVSSCDILYTENMEEFNRQYLEHTAQVAATCQDRDLSDDCMVIGTSAIIDTEIDGAVGMNSGIFQQSVSHLGAVQKEMVPLRVAHLLPIPSHTDGWCPCWNVPGKFAERNRKRQRMNAIIYIHK